MERFDAHAASSSFVARARQNSHRTRVLPVYTYVALVVLSLTGSCASAVYPDDGSSASTDASSEAGIGHSLFGPCAPSCRTLDALAARCPIEGACTHDTATTSSAQVTLCYPTGTRVGGSMSMANGDVRLVGHVFGPTGLPCYA